MGGNATSPLHSRGSPKKGGQKQNWRGPKVSKMVHHPCILGGPQQRGQNQRGPTSGRKCYITPAFSGVPNKGDKIKRGPQVGRNATSPLHSRGSPNKGGENQNSMPNPCLLGGPQVGGNATSPLHSRDSQRKGDKIRIGCLTPAFWEAHKWAEMLHHPCILGDPQRRGQSQSKKKAKKTKTKTVRWCP